MLLKKKRYVCGVHPRCKAAVFKALISKKLKDSTGLLYDIILAVGFFFVVSKFFLNMYFLTYILKEQKYFHT